MFFYEPKTKFGKVKNNLTIFCLKLNLVWPLRDNVSFYIYFCYRFLVFVLLFSYIVAILGHILYIFQNQSDIRKISECLCTKAVGIQYLSRMVYNLYKIDTMKTFLEAFFTNIYISEEEDPKGHKRCERFHRRSYFVTMNFIVPLSYLLFSALVESLKNPTGRKTYVYRMEFPYDAQEPTKYFFTQFFCSWVGISCVTMMTAEDGVVCGALVYTEERYIQLHQKLQDLLEVSYYESRDTSRKLSFIFKDNLIEIIRKQQIIDDFNKIAESFLSFKAFMCISFAALSLCSIALQLAMMRFRIEDLVYIVWLGATCFELLILGDFGQKYTDAAEKMGIMYYMCNWEYLLSFEKLKDIQEILKLLNFAIFRCQRPVRITGLHFVALSKETVMNTLNTTMSYFMFLRAFAS